MEYSEPVIISTKTPTYLTSLLNKTENILLAFAVNDVPNDVFETPHSESTTNNTFMDITGSPLKVSLDNSDLLNLSMSDLCTPWTNAEENQFPVSVDTARKFITEYFSKGINETKKTSIWCLCDSHDYNKTIMLGAYQTSEFLMRTAVTANGYFPLSHPSLNLDIMCENHFKYTSSVVQNTSFIRRRIDVPLRELESRVTSTYEILGTTIQANNFEKCTDVKSSATLKVSWNTITRDPVESSSCSMLIQTAVGQKQSCAFNLWKDLILLELYVKALSEYNCETMVDNYWLPSSADNDKNIDLIDLIIGIIKTTGRNTRFNDKFESMDLQTLAEYVEITPSTDITDQLWNVLTHCRTYGALRECLNVLFTEIAYSDAKIYLSESNKTGIAEIIRGIATGKLAVPTCSGTQPIELLIEIGMEKLKKDFFFIFTSAGIVDSQELQDLFSKNVGEEISYKTTDMYKNRTRLLLAPKKPIINLSNTEKTMKALGQLYVILEMLLIVPVDCMQYIAPDVYNKYTGLDSPIDSFSSLAKNKMQEICVSVQYHNIQQHVSRSTPTSWHLTLVSTYATYSVQSVIYLSQGPIFPPSLYKNSFKEKSDAEKTEPYYHSTHLVQITTNLT